MTLVLILFNGIIALVVAKTTPYKFNKFFFILQNIFFAKEDFFFQKILKLTTNEVENISKALQDRLIKLINITKISQRSCTIHFLIP